MSIDLIAACQSSRIVTDEAETLRDTLDDVTHAITTSVDILNDLLTFDKLQSGVMQIHVTDINVKSFVQDCCSIFMSQARGDNIRLAVLFADDSVAGSTPITAQDMVRCDKFKTSQVVRNLLSNALKFTPDAGSVVVRVCFVPFNGDEGEEEEDEGHFQGLVLPSTHASESSRPRSTVASMLSRVQSAFVSVSGQLPRPSGLEDEGRLPMADDVARTRGALHLSVTDSGAGISQTDQARLFREVVQFNPDVLQGGGGSGLGLFICKSIVDLHGGRIGVASEGEGLGSTFSVVLPMFREERTSADSTPHHTPRHTPRLSPRHTPRDFSSPPSHSTHPQSRSPASNPTHLLPQMAPADRHRSTDIGHGLSPRSMDVEEGKAHIEVHERHFPGGLPSVLPPASVSARADESLPAVLPAVDPPNLSGTTRGIRADRSESDCSVSTSDQASEDDIPFATSTPHSAGRGRRGYGNGKSGRKGRDNSNKNNSGSETRNGDDTNGNTLVVRDATMQRLLQCLDRGRGITSQGGGGDGDSSWDLVDGQASTGEDMSADTADTADMPVMSGRLAVEPMLSDDVHGDRHRSSRRSSHSTSRESSGESTGDSSRRSSRSNSRQSSRRTSTSGPHSADGDLLVNDATLYRLLQCLDRGRGMAPPRSVSGWAGEREASSEGGRSVGLVDLYLDIAATVLVVEDAAVNRRVMVKLFRSLGQEVEGVSNGLEAVNKVMKRMASHLPPYDAILMDYKMVSEWLCELQSGFVDLLFFHVLRLAI